MFGWLRRQLRSWLTVTVAVGYKYYEGYTLASHEYRDKTVNYNQSIKVGSQFYFHSQVTASFIRNSCQNKRYVITNK